MEDQAPYGKVVTKQPQLQANELRIGNLASTPNQPIFRIDLFDYVANGIGKFGQINDANTHPLTWYLQDLKPIPLTDEILHQTNLENEFSSEWKLYNPATEESFVIEKFNDGYYYTGGEGVKKSRKIEYLHHLQNLCFDIIGIELIYNPKTTQIIPNP